MHETYKIKVHSVFHFSVSWWLHFVWVSCLLLKVLPRTSTRQYLLYIITEALDLLRGLLWILLETSKGSYQFLFNLTFIFKEIVNMWKETCLRPYLDGFLVNFHNKVSSLLGFAYLYLGFQMTDFFNLEAKWSGEYAAKQLN